MYFSIIYFRNFTAYYYKFLNLSNFRIIMIYFHIYFDGNISKKVIINKLTFMLKELKLTIVLSPIRNNTL